MDVICCIKSVPNLADAEVQIARHRASIDSYPRCLNDWDRYVLEEALRLTEVDGGSMTALTFGDPQSEDVLRRALALGASGAVMVAGELNEEPRRVATALAAVIRARQFDLVLTGAQAADREGGEVGGMIAALLDVPFASLVIAVERKENRLIVHRETEGGELEIHEIELPAVLSLQTGINTPRYVSMRGIRKASAQTIARVIPGPPVRDPGVRLLEHRCPPAGVRATILHGDLNASALEVARLIRERGGLQ